MDAITVGHVYLPTDVVVLLDGVVLLVVSVGPEQPKIMDNSLGTLGDVNECLSNNGGCQHRCVNRRGANRTCACYQGYKSNPYDNRRCIDVNECHTGRVCSCGFTGSGNVCGARCTNTVGSFRCSCGNGYSLQRGTVCI
ncbi:hypothetical protein OS493_024604, partial [Desmophyllum pertusum]